jgi:hypothetical protein
MKAIIASEADMVAAIKKLDAAFVKHGGLALEISPIKDKRSLAQNALMWVWNTALADQMCTPEAMHEAMKLLLLPLKMRLLGQDMVIANSTANLTKEQFADYLTRYEVFCNERGLFLPASQHYETAMKG